MGKKKRLEKRVSFRVYLSGSMSSRLVEQVKAERQLAIDLCAKAGMYAVDPADSEQKLWKPGKKSKIAVKFPPKIMQAFIKRDKFLIRHSDALIVMTGDTPSDGTWWEMCYAHDIGIPVVMISPKRATGEMVGWSNFLVDDLVGDLTSAVRLIRRKYFKEKVGDAKYWDNAIKNAKKAIGHTTRTKKKAQQKRAQKLAAKVAKQASDKVEQKAAEMKKVENRK